MDSQAVQTDYRAHLRRNTLRAAAIIMAIDALAVIAVLLLVK